MARFKKPPTKSENTKQSSKRYSRGQFVMFIPFKRFHAESNESTIGIASSFQDSSLDFAWQILEYFFRNLLGCLVFRLDDQVGTLDIQFLALLEDGTDLRFTFQVC